MKKLVALVAIILCFYFLYGSFKRISPPYFIKIAETEYKFEDFFQGKLSHDTYDGLSKYQKFSKIYEQLKVYLCKPDCNISVFSFDNIPVDLKTEGLFYRNLGDLSEESIQRSRVELASEQYFFSILDRTLVIINDASLKLKVEGSIFPWIGKTQDGLLVEFMYASNFNEWFRPWVLRFIRDYRSVVKIHIFPFEEGVDFMEQVKTAVCLKEKRVFWDKYLDDTLDLQGDDCQPSREIPVVEKHDLAIRLGAETFQQPKSYLELVKNFQISYLALKVR